MTLRGLAALGVLVVAGCGHKVAQREELPSLDYPNVTTSMYGEGWSPCANFADYCICIQTDARYAVISNSCQVSQGGKTYPKAVYFCPIYGKETPIMSDCMELANHGVDLLDTPIRSREKR